jgi:hypothetical protein
MNNISKINPDSFSYKTLKKQKTKESGLEQNKKVFIFYSVCAFLRTIVPAAQAFLLGPGQAGKVSLDFISHGPRTRTKTLSLSSARDKLVIVNVR